MSRQPRLRLSIVVEVGEPARAALAKALEPLVAAHPGLRWVDPGCWYIEVCALGRLAADQAEQVDAVVEEAAAANAPVVLRLDGAPGIRDRHALVAEVEPSVALDALRTDLVGRLGEVGVAVERARSLPHSVVACAPGGTRVPAGITSAFRGPTVTWTARRLLVVRTRLRVGGVAYEVRCAHGFGLPVGASR